MKLFQAYVLVHLQWKGKRAEMHMIKIKTSLTHTKNNTSTLHKITVGRKWYNYSCGLSSPSVCLSVCLCTR